MVFRNGRVVLELDPSQMDIVKADAPPREKAPAELLEDKKKRDEAFGSFFTSMVEDLSNGKRNKGDDGTVTCIVVS